MKYHVRKLKIVLFIAILGFFSGCSAPKTITPQYSLADVQAEQHKQRCLAVQEHREINERLANVSSKVLHGALSFSKKQKDYFGFLIYDKEYFDNEYKNAFSEVYNLQDRPKVVWVAENSPAQIAGLMVGDEVISMDNFPIPKNPKDLKKSYDIVSADGVITFKIIRENEQHSIKVNSVKALNIPVELIDTTDVNAYADGEKIYITKGLMRLAHDDNELATVISHELAHNIRGHVSMSKKNAMTGGFFGILADIGAAALGVNTQGQFTKIGMDAGQNAYSKEMEKEADYVGLYILANSGYNLSKGINIFRRLGTVNPKSIEMKYARSHPSTPERFVMLEETNSEIQQKIHSGLQLIPYEKQ